MKNIHLISTKPNDETAKGIWIKETRDWCNLYITNDEEIKEGDWKLDTFHNQTSKVTNINSISKYDSKIILTKDQDLIADGVQSIDDDFLEWFVNNLSCEEVEVKTRYLHYYKTGETFISFSKTPDFSSRNMQCIKIEPRYKIIIPKEEPKQETLEEVELAILFHNTYQRLAPSFGYETRADTKLFNSTTPNGKLMIAICKEIIKWQTERMYSEEEVINAFNEGQALTVRGKLIQGKEWFEQFKK